MLPRSSESLDCDDLARFEAHLKQEAGRYRPSSEADGHALAARVFGRVDSKTASRVLNGDDLEKSVFGSVFKPRPDYKPDPLVVFGELDRPDNTGRLEYKVTQRTVVNRDGKTTELAPNRVVGVGIEGLKEFHLTLAEAAFYEKRGYIKRVV